MLEDGGGRGGVVKELLVGQRIGERNDEERRQEIPEWCVKRVSAVYSVRGKTLFS